MYVKGIVVLTNLHRITTDSASPQPLGSKKHLRICQPIVLILRPANLLFRALSYRQQEATQCKSSDKLIVPNCPVLNYKQTQFTTNW